MPKKRGAIARKERAALLSAAALLAMGASTARAQDPAFPDVPENHWAYQAIRSLADRGLIKGYPDGKFLGSRTLTRYEFASALDRVLQTVSAMAKPVLEPIRLQDQRLAADLIFPGTASCLQRDRQRKPSADAGGLLR